VAIGDTEEETRRNFQDAPIEHFQAMCSVGEPIPEPHASVDYVEIAAQPPSFVPAPWCRLHAPSRRRTQFSGLAISRSSGVL